MPPSTSPSPSPSPSEAKFMMLCPINCQYSRHSMKSDRGMCSDMLLRANPGFLSNSLPANIYGLPMPTLNLNRPTMQEQHLLPLFALPRDTVNVVTEKTDSAAGRYQPVEEPWLLISYGQPNNAGGMDNDHSKMGTSADKSGFSSSSSVDTEIINGQLNIESPSYSSLYEGLIYPSTKGSKAGTGSVDDEKSTGLREQLHQVTEELNSLRETNLPPKDSVSTEILINRSVLTMQRIAVLEDGKLVELLLEPVKSNVQCDNVYLGVVKNLVPHMCGAFVNIGSYKSSFMKIKAHKEPFIFPPFASTASKKDVGGPSGSGGKEKDVNGSSFRERVKTVNGSLVDLVARHLNSSQNGQIYLDEDDAALSDDDTEVDFEEEDLGDHEPVKIQSRAPSCKDNNDTSGLGQKWARVRKGTKVIVQVAKEGLGNKGPVLTPYPILRSRFWVLHTRTKRVGVSVKIPSLERGRLKVIAKSLQPPGFGLTVRTVAAGHSMEELQKDLDGLLSTWKNIMKQAKSAALAADEGITGAAPILLHQAMGQTLLVVQDYFNEKVTRMVVDSPRTYYEVINYLQDFAPDLCDRVELHKKKIPLFDVFKIEEEIDNILNRRVPLPTGGSLVIEQTEALVSIDVNGGHVMLGKGTSASQQKAILDVNLAAAKQIARELRLRDIGGIIVVDFIDMLDDSNKRLVYEVVKKAVERDRSPVRISELSKNWLMEITRKRVRPSVTFMISEPCRCCHGMGRVEAQETSFAKIEHEICRVLATADHKADPNIPKSWPRLLLKVDRSMSEYMTSGQKTRLANLIATLKVRIVLKIFRNFTRGEFEVELLANEKVHGDEDTGASNPDQPRTGRTKWSSLKQWQK